MRRRKNLNYLINNNVLWRLYDIKYDSNRTDLPTEIIVDLNKFPWFNDIPVGLGNLNCKASRAIKEITGCNSLSCKAEVLRKNIVA